MPTDLTHKKCTPCEGGTPPLSKVQSTELLKQIPEWEITDDGKKITRTFTFANFVESVDFINKVKDIAEGENHHPDLHLHSYKNVTVDLSTHAIKGLSENDFIVAAKIDALS